MHCIKPDLIPAGKESVTSLHFVETEPFVPDFKFPETPEDFKMLEEMGDKC